MENSEFSLSLNNIETIPLDKYEKNFTIIVNNERYKTSRVIVDLLSPTIRKLHYQDSTLDEYSINTKSKTEYFDEFLNLTNFKQTKIDSTRRKHFKEYFLQLGNIEEYFKLDPGYLTEINSSNIIDKLQEINELINDHTIQEILININNDKTYFKSIIDYASNHFSEFDKDQIKLLDIRLIEEIITNNELQIEEEDELLNFVLDLYEGNENLSYLFEYIYFINIKDENLEKFISLFNIEYLNLGTWRSICDRLLPSKLHNHSKNNESRYKKHKEQKSDPNIILKPYKEGDEFNGIMRYLSSEIQGNIHDKGIIEIKSNSFNGDSYHPKNLVDYNKDNYYDSYSYIENATVCFDFKDKTIQISSYSIQSNNKSPNSYHLKN